MVSFLIVYASWSGNTEEVAEIIEETLIRKGMDVTMYKIGSGPIPDPQKYEAMMIGSFTWGKGSTPIPVKNFVAELGYKPETVYVFGTGDTQFGGDQLFCHAAEKLAKFYHSAYKPLKIEQSPRGKQYESVMKWTEGVWNHWKSLQKLKC